MTLYIRQSTLLFSSLLLTLVGASGCGNFLADTPNNSAQVSPEVTVARETDVNAQRNSAPNRETTKRVQVFFPKDPESLNDFTHVTPVTRTTASEGVARFAIEQLIAGPTSQEKKRGLLDPIEFIENSNCGKEDFTIAIAQQVAKLRFCRPILSAGIGDDARVQSSIDATLKQFPTVDTVVILDSRGDCFGDLSGDNRCFAVLPQG